MHNYAGNSTLFPPQVGLVDDSDLNPATAATLDVAGQNLADRTAYLKAHIGSKFLVNELSQVIFDDPGDAQALSSPDLSIESTIYVPLSQVGFSNIGGGVASVTSTSPPVVQFNAPHGLSGSPVVYYSLVSSSIGMGGLADFWQATIVDATHIALVGAPAPGATSGSACVSLPYLALFPGHVPFDEWVLSVDGNFVLNASQTAKLCLMASAVPTGLLAANGQPGGNFGPAKCIGAKAFALGTGFGTPGPVSLRTKQVGGNVTGYLAVGMGVLIPANPGSGVTAAAAWGDLVFLAQQFRGT